MAKVKNSNALRDKDKEILGFMLLALRDLEMGQEAAEDLYRAVQVSITAYQRGYAEAFWLDFTNGDRLEWENT